jgi:site-specific DNA recombinase
MAGDRPKRMRCAIYTRKSSEEGLEQAFNSLDAQREASEAYIKSQAGEGWQLVGTRYDDGGISGGTMDRPALNQLLADIKARKIDAVVVYKVDRLTRSLADFAKIVDVFDAHSVSFVSVTQQFNTTTSMGRLTLNMLLSFAQFEREVTGERIRDKIAASKKKGMWMGGFVPLGYEAKERTLVINTSEAETVRTVCRLYLEHNNVGRVKAEAYRLGLTTKVRETGDGRMRGGRPLSRGHIYKLLNNPIYVGRIAHKNAVYEGQHAAIIDAETWDAVQAKLAKNAHQHRSGTRAAEPSMLAGLLYDEQGNRLSPSHAVKSGKRYRYYVSRNLIDGSDTQNDSDGLRIPAHEIETMVAGALEQLLLSRTRLFDLLELESCRPTQVHRVLLEAKRVAGISRERSKADAIIAVQTMLDRAIVAQDEVRLTISATGTWTVLGLDPTPAGESMTPSDPSRLCINVPARIRRCGGSSRLIITDDGMETAREPDLALVRILSRAHDWFNRLSTGKAESAADIARNERLTRSYVTRVVRLAFLAPDITEAILKGRQPQDLNAERLVRHSRLPLAWDDQRRLLGIRRR